LTRLAALGIDAPYVAAPLAAGIEEFVPYVAVPTCRASRLMRRSGSTAGAGGRRDAAHHARGRGRSTAASHAGVHHGSLHPRDIIVTPATRT